MDGLALLCNLFADGPVTLKRLRAARVTSLGDLERAAPERLAEWLHASVPQARSFVDEARKLLRRLNEATPAPQVRASLRDVGPSSFDRFVGAPAIDAVRDIAAQLLHPGLFPGLDESVCARLSQHHVRTIQALSESAGLALARRTGIPYSTLLDLARHARRSALGGPRPRRATPASELSEGKLVPFISRPRRAPAENDLVPSDGFTLPVVEPESSGPFG